MDYLFLNRIITPEADKTRGRYSKKTGNHLRKINKFASSSEIDAIKWYLFRNPYEAYFKFPMQKLAIFCKVKEIRELHGDVQLVRRTRNSAD